MAIYSQKEICNILGIKTNALRVYIHRGKVKIENGTFDDSEPLNRIFLNKQKIKKNVVIKEETFSVPDELKEPKQIKEVSEIPESKKQKRNKKEIDEDLQDDSQGNLFAQKTKWEIQRLKNQDTLNKIQIAKLEGQLIPVEVAQQVFLWSTETLKKW
jgi:hypothetical protein